MYSLVMKLKYNEVSLEGMACCGGRRFRKILQS
jgi:hypothetical protein